MKNSERIARDLTSWPGVSAHPHRFGGTEYRLGKRELGHVHGERLVDIPFPKRVRDEVIAQGEAERHHVLPESGWVSIYLHKPEDVTRALSLLERSYALAKAQVERKLIGDSLLSVGERRVESNQAGGSVMPQTEPPVQIAQAWQKAVNAQDRDRLLALSHPDIEIVGPRGVAKGHEILLAWLERAGLSLETRRVFAGEERVVFAQHGVWRSLETGAVQGEAEVASSFLVRDGQVTEIARYDTLSEALGRAGLSEDDEVL